MLSGTRDIVAYGTWEGESVNFLPNPLNPDVTPSRCFFLKSESVTKRHRTMMRATVSLIEKGDLSFTKLLRHYELPVACYWHPSLGWL